MTMAAGLGALEDESYFRENCQKIIQNREFTMAELEKLDFTSLESQSNFVFAKHPALPGKELYLELKRRGILIRHFDKPRLRDYIRITIGTAEQMRCFITTIQQILEETL